MVQGSCLSAVGAVGGWREKGLGPSDGAAGASGADSSPSAGFSVCQAGHSVRIYYQETGLGPTVRAGTAGVWQVPHPRGRGFAPDSSLSVPSAEGQAVHPGREPGVEGVCGGESVPGLS